jgi:hypothetical protein
VLTAVIAARPTIISWGAGLREIKSRYKGEKRVASFLA